MSERVAIPPRPEGAKTLTYSVKVGPRNVKLAVPLARVNIDRTAVVVQSEEEGAVTFHVSTRGFYVTADLSAELNGLRIDDASAQASYDGKVLTVIVALASPPEEVEAKRRHWHEPETIKQRMDAKAEARRRRETELASAAATAARESAAAPAKRRKKQPKKAPLSDGPALEQRIASEAGAQAEAKTKEAVQKDESKARYLQSKEAEREQKRAKRHGTSDAIAKSVKETVTKQFSREGQVEARKQKKERRRAAAAAVVAKGQRKSVKFANNV